MYKRILSLLICMSMILISCSNQKTNQSTNQNVTKPTIENNVSVNEDKYDILALKSGKQGIEKDNIFQLTSKEKISKNYIENNLKIIPEQQFKVEEVSSTVFNIIPLSLLEDDKVYQVKLNDENYDYSWAFQTRKKFEVTSTIPSNNSSNVPANSGIEMYFSLDNVDNIDDYFEIKPNVEGKFIQKNNAVVFVPELLEKNTKYTVNIKKGFGLKDSEDKLEEDYTFSFNTNTENYLQIYFNSPLTNIYEENKKIIEAYASHESEIKEFNINIYQYKNADAFEKNIKYYAETSKIINDPNNDADLVKFNSIKQKPYLIEDSYPKKSLFQLPEELNIGYYLLEFCIDGYSNKYYHFLQVNDMLVYNAFFDNQILVFSSDGKDSQGIDGAKVIINGENIGTTGKDGIMLKDKDTSIYRDKAINMRIKAEGYNDFIYAENNYFNIYYYENLNESYKYLRYIDTDRPVYLPTDTINVWGFARYRDNKSINKLKVELVEQNTDLILESKYVDLTKIGTYQTDFKLNNITSYGCYINVYDNDVKISTKYLEISEYTKPLYTLSGELNNEFVYSGEKLHYKLNSNFFDGYPVPNLDVQVSTYNYGYGNNVEYNNMNETIKLDENGEYIVNVNTDLKSDNWRPITVHISSFNSKAEDTEVRTNDTFEIFPKHKMLEIEQNSEDIPQSVDILFHELLNTKYKSKDYNGDYKDLRGNPLDDIIIVKVIERYNEKVKKGDHYDFINKVNVIDYEYNLIENMVYSESIKTVNGKSNIEIPNFNPDRDYKVVAYYDDGNGGIIEEKYVGEINYYSNNLYYRIENMDKKDKGYRLGDTVNLQLTYNGEDVLDVDDDNLVLMLMRNGLVDYKLLDKSKIQFAFEEKHLPNVSINGLYIKDGYIYPIYSYIGYDRTERQIYFDVATNKEEYRPGEEVVLNIKAKDEKNRPCVADVNISVVDEAYFAVFGKYVYTLMEIYQPVCDSGLRFSYISNIDLSLQDDGDAEMGGGGGSGETFRDEFKDTNIFKTITTDKNGNATMKFKLADNLTSWRITYQAVSDELYAGSGTKNIAVSLPFYVDLIIGKEHLKEDKIYASLRVFGTETKESEQVNYKVVVKNKETGKELEYTETGIVGEYTNVFLDNLKEGQYEIYAYADSKGKKDGIKEEFKVVDSTIYFNNTDYYKLTDSTVLDKVYSNPIITLFNESTSDFYNSLNNIYSNYGRRIDQTVCSLIATKYINGYFNTDLYFNEEELLQEIEKYESEYGGFSLLPYSSADVELTSKLINIIDNDFLNAKTKIYFKNILDSNDEYNINISAALWGLSKYKEPVLLNIYNLLENDNLEMRDKIYLSLALTELGDFKTANKYYKEFIDNNIVKSGDYLYLDTKTNDLDRYELTSLLAVLGVKLQDFENGDKLFKYIYNNPSKYTLSNFEQLIYIMNRDIMNLQEIKDLFGEITVTIDGKKQIYKLKLFDRESFAVTKDKIKDIKFSNIKGDIACKVEALGNKDDLDKNRTDDFSISVSYMLKNSSNKNTNYNQSDIVKVTITPSFSPMIERGEYEVTYVIPSGFRHMDIVDNSDISTSWTKSNTEMNGQKLRINLHYDRETFAPQPMVFYIQATQMGEYTVDYIVIKEYLENKLNYINKSTLTVN